MDDFEKDATRKQEGGSHASAPEEPEESISCLEDCLSAVIEAFCGILIATPEGDAQAGAPPRAAVGAERAGGEPATRPSKRLPTLYARLSLGATNTDVTNWDGLLQVGHRALALRYRHTHLREATPQDYLDIDQLDAVVRVAFPRVTAGIGFGAVNLRGDESSLGHSLVLPVEVELAEWLGLVWQPAWSYIEGGRVNDQDLGLSFSRGKLALETGYRWLRTENVRLDGPYVGVAVRF